jgi:hypothetical protein
MNILLFLISPILVVSLMYTSEKEIVKPGINNQLCADNNGYFRRIIIDKYLLNKEFRIKYYNSYSGSGPDGGVFFTIAEVNNKYYTGDFYAGEEVIQNADSEQLKSINSWRIKFHSNLEFEYSESETKYRGKISYKAIEWRDDSFMDSTYLCSIKISDDQLKVPLGIIELETVRGSFDFYIYYLIGKAQFSFNGKDHYAYNPIVFESMHVTKLFVESTE